MITENQRNYEVSIWTLQDSFITVLKPTNLEFKGQIQDPDMVLKDDGTLNFSFSIPMYIRSFPIPHNTQESKGELVENPIWYNTRNGVIAASMRKLKVIFNKFEDPTVFEFIITKVTETHEKGQLTCKIESEGLAFHELGRQGVIVSLSADDYSNDYDEWRNLKPVTHCTTSAGRSGDMFNVDSCTITDQNINLFLVPTNRFDMSPIASRSWRVYYNGVSYKPDWFMNRPVPSLAFTIVYELTPGFRVIIDNSMITSNTSTIELLCTDSSHNVASIIISFDCKKEQDEPINNIDYWTNKALKLTNWTYDIQMNYDGYINRLNNKIYEDSYVADWTLENENTLTPARIEDSAEKLRMVDISDSNLYNITQKIAETFEVYCKYKYEYDSSFHIIGRKIIYYNSFIQDAAGALDITYPYDTDKITRTMDGTDICTKLYVKKVEDDTAPAGYISIMSSSANPSGEDYILNFDYLHKIGTITEEQYAAVKPYEISMRQFNIRLQELTELIAKAQIELQEYEATITIAKNGLIQYEEQISEFGKLHASITEDTGYIELEAATAAHGTLVPDSESSIGAYKINLTQLGIVNNQLIFTNPNKIAYVKIFTDRTKIGEITPTSEDSQNERGNYILVGEGNNLSFKYDDSNNIIGITGFSKNDEARSRYLIFAYNPQLYSQTKKKQSMKMIIHHILLKWIIQK